jgi:hypothetical protein
MIKNGSPAQVSRPADPQQFGTQQGHGMLADGQMHAGEVRLDAFGISHRGQGRGPAVRGGFKQVILVQPLFAFPQGGPAMLAETIQRPDLGERAQLVPAQPHPPLEISE